MCGTPAPCARIWERMVRMREERAAYQPITGRTAGSTFKNPEGAKARLLIGQSGCSGLVRGGAQVSPINNNFLINRNGATAEDIEELGEEVRRRVIKATGVRLEWEVVRMGRRAGALDPDRGIIGSCATA
jgi:UDP-N-acetylmuramate dehydrogenase